MFFYNILKDFIKRVYLIEVNKAKNLGMICTFFI